MKGLLLPMSDRSEDLARFELVNYNSNVLPSGVRLFDYWGKKKADEFWWEGFTFLLNVLSPSIQPTGWAFPLGAF